MAKKASQIVKKAHPDSVASYINQRFNNDSLLNVKVERGIWTMGKNAAIDKYGFKNKETEYTANEKFPEVMVYGKVIKAPEAYTDDRGRVTTDYQDYLEKQWIAALRKKYTIEMKMTAEELKALDK
jgi:peptidyl-prolyl cis-trans isomerase SurA